MLTRKVLSFVMIMCMLCLLMPNTATAQEIDITEPTTLVGTEAEDRGEFVIKQSTNADGETYTALFINEEIIATNLNPAEGEARWILTRSCTSEADSPYALDERIVTDYVYMRVLDYYTDDVLSVYQITVTGVVSRVNSSRAIDSIDFTHISGDVCEKYYFIDGYNAGVSLVHHSGNSFEAGIFLGTGGTFTYY